MHQEKLLALIKTSSDNITILSRENSSLEFKKAFSLGSRGRYAKTMAAFANASGGFIVFGITDSPRMLQGLSDDRFNRLEPTQLTGFLNEHFSPEIEWESGIFEINGKQIGFIYTAESNNKPVLCSNTSGQDITEGRIYYRYRGQSLEIKYPELKKIIEDKLELERRAWMQHIQKIATAGPTNIGILNTLDGKLYGAGKPYLISPDLVKKLRFIKEGTFHETGGEPTLTLIGEITQAGPIMGIQEVPTTIHTEDIYNAFLSTQVLSEQHALVYFQESLMQNSIYIPIYYFKKQANIPTDKSIELLSILKVHKANKVQLTKRLEGKIKIEKVAVFESNQETINNYDDFIQKYEVAATLKQKRSLVYSFVKGKISEIIFHLQSFDYVHVFEVITALDSDFVRKNHLELKKILLTIYKTDGSKFNTSVNGIFRKSLCKIDEIVYSEHDF